MTNCKKNIVYEGLADIESNGVSDWLEKESTRLVARSLAPQAKKLQSIDELFLASKRIISRNDTQLKYSFPKLKKIFQFFKHPSDFAHKSVLYI